MFRTSARTRPISLLAGAVLILGLASTAHGQTSLTWSGLGADTNWTDVANWALGGNPAGVYPNNGQPAAANTYNAIINSGSPTLDTNITIIGLTLGAGAIGGGGNLTVNGLLSWSGGTIGGTGTTTLGGGATLDNTNASLFLNQQLNNASGSIAAHSGGGSF